MQISPSLLYNAMVGDVWTNTKWYASNIDVNILNATQLILNATQSNATQGMLHSC